jgi:hypothetical protein
LVHFKGSYAIVLVYIVLVIYSKEFFMPGFIVLEPPYITHKSDKCTLSFSLSDAAVLPDASVIEDTENAMLSIEMPLLELLKNKIEFRRLCQEAVKAFDEHDRPHFAVIKADLLALGARIDAFEYRS